VVRFGVSEYTLVFRRDGGRGTGRPLGRWSVARPFAPSALVRRGAAKLDAVRTEELFVVPICSTLALDPASYERFLSASGVLDEALQILGNLSLAEAERAETARKEIQSIVMAAEVQYIVEGMTA
jgi:hypothetical protein